jgi:murein DD-endopeptidase MepM/ murein hydrolase activator NlpD
MLWHEEKAEYVVRNFEHAAPSREVKRPRTGELFARARAAFRDGTGTLRARIARITRMMWNTRMMKTGVRPRIRAARVRLRTASRMAKAIFSHIARRLSFSVKTGGVIVTCFFLPKFRKDLSAKASEGYRGARDVAANPSVRAYTPSVLVGALAVCGILFFSTIITSDFTYYEYSYKGKVLGVVKNEAEVYLTVSRPEVKEAIDERAGASIVPDELGGIAVKKVIKLASADVPVDKEDDIITNIASLDEVGVVGQAVYSDGESIGTVASEAEADRLLELVKEQALAGESPERFSEVDFTGEVTRGEARTKRKNIETADEIVTRLAQTSFSAIGVRTVETVNYEEEYEETPVYVDDEERYEDYELVVTPGATGLRKVTADLVRVSGELTEQHPTAYEVVRPAVAAYVVRGAKKLPEPIGKGMFVRPAEGGSLSSPFGPRWGRMHEGIDIDIKYAPVYAAGDGKVVYTGNRGDGYGVMITIDHGDGYSTLYGHLSRSAVQIGDEVYKGQRIATSGNTGRSTGAHLHFEVRVNGTPRDPLDYL